jgi:hypothetical protein
VAAWLIITGSGLDDWIYYRLLCRIYLNHNQLQELAISLQPNPSSLTAEDSPHSRSRSTTHSNWTTQTLSRHGPRTENTALLFLRACLLGFPRDRYPASPLARWLLLATAEGRTHRKHRSCIVGRVFVWTCLPSNGFFWLHGLMLWANPLQYSKLWLLQVANKIGKLQSIPVYTEFACALFVSGICLHTKFHVFYSSGSVFITIINKTKYRFHSSTIFLSYILQKNIK